MAGPNMNFWRQLGVFDPNKFTKTVHIVGCGAIGSNLLHCLLRSGIGRIHVYDFDKVEDHNLPNQWFREEHVGKPKAEACKQLAKELGYDIEATVAKIETIESNEPGYIFMCVDSMKTRKDIFENAAKFNPTIRFIECRMAAEYGLVYYVNPVDPDQVEAWEAQWFPDNKEGIEEAPCTVRAIATTAFMLVSHMVHGLIAWEAGEQPKMRYLYSMRPPLIQQWDPADEKKKQARKLAAGKK